VPGPGQLLSIAFASDGTLLGVGTDSNMYIFTGTATSGNWIPIPSNQKIISICFGGTQGRVLYGVGPDYYVYYSTDYRSVTWTKMNVAAGVIAIDMMGVGGGGK
jgi:hypothetical protein